MYTVLVAVLPILIVALVVVVACRITTVVVIVAVLITLLIVERPLFTMLGTVLLLTVRTIAVVLFVAAFAIFAALLTGGTVFLIQRR